MHYTQTHKEKHTNTHTSIYINVYIYLYIYIYIYNVINTFNEANTGMDINLHKETFIAYTYKKIR